MVSLFSVVAHLMFPCLDFFAVFSVVMLMHQGFINVFFFFFLDERINRVPKKKKKTLINPCYACTEFALLDSFFLNKGTYLSNLLLRIFDTFSRYKLWACQANSRKAKLT